MIKLIISVILIFSTLSPVLGVCGDICPDKTQFSHGTGFHDSSDSQNSNSQDDHSASDQDHCLVHCSHAPSLTFHKVTIELTNVELNNPIFLYSFLYENPIIESFERPPLAS